MAAASTLAEAEALRPVALAAAQILIGDTMQQQVLVFGAMQQRPPQQGARGKHPHSRRESVQQVRSHRLQQRLEAQLNSCQASTSAHNTTATASVGSSSDVHTTHTSGSSNAQPPVLFGATQSGGEVASLLRELSDSVESELSVRFESAVARERPWWMTHKQLSILRMSLHPTDPLPPADVQAARHTSLPGGMKDPAEVESSASTQEPFLLGVLQLLGRVIVPQASRPDATWVVGQIQSLLQDCV